MPVWVAPKSVPISSCAAIRTTRTGESSRPPGAAWPSLRRVRAVGCSANAVPKTASIAAASSSAPLGENITTPSPTSAGPIAKDASSAAPS